MYEDTSKTSCTDDYNYYRPDYCNRSLSIYSMEDSEVNNNMSYEKILERILYTCATIVACALTIGIVLITTEVIYKVLGELK